MITLLIVGLWFGEIEPTNVIIDVISTDSFRECSQLGEDYPIPEDVDAITWICLSHEEEEDYVHEL